MSIRRAPVRRVLVVCLGNHCRSPLAAAALARLGPPGVQVRSAGLSSRHSGKPAHPAMIAAAARHGYDLSSHRGTQVTGHLLEWPDLILALDSTILTALRQLTGDRGRPELGLYLGDQDVPDPWGQSQDVFDRCAALIQAGASQAL